MSLETNIRTDYWNEYFPATIAFRMHGCAGVAENMIEFPVKTYLQRYTSAKPGSLITDQNRAAVQHLDELAAEANKMTNPAYFTERDFKSLINEVHHLIHGKGLHYFYKDA